MSNLSIRLWDNSSACGVIVLGSAADQIDSSCQKRSLLFGCPDEIGHLCDRDPAVVFPYDKHHHGNCDQDDQSVRRGERKVSQAKLDRCEKHVGDQVDRERNGNLPRELLPDGLNENVTERDENDRVENLPD